MPSETPDEILDDLDTLLDAGLQQISVEGMFASFNTAEIRRQKLERQRADEANKTRKPRLSSLRLDTTF